MNYWMFITNENIAGLEQLGFSLSSTCYLASVNGFSTLRISGRNVWNIPSNDRNHQHIDLEEASQLMTLINLGLDTEAITLMLRKKHD